MCNALGKSAKPGYISGNTQSADNLSYDRIKGALGNMQNPEQYSVGNSPIGFGNSTFTQKYNPYQYSMPSALNTKGGIFADTMNNMQTNLLRQEKGAGDEFKRSAQLAGSYNPAMMKNMLGQGQRQTQETMGEYGTKGALDMATEQAKAQEGMQKNQAGENQVARGLDLEGAGKAIQGEQVGLQADTQNKAYFGDLLQKLYQNQIDPYAGQKGGTPAKQGWLPGLVNAGTQVAGTVAKFM